MPEQEQVQDKEQDKEQVVKEEVKAEPERKRFYFDGVPYDLTEQEVHAILNEGYKVLSNREREGIEKEEGKLTEEDEKREETIEERLERLEKELKQKDDKEREVIRRGEQARVLETVVGNDPLVKKYKRADAIAKELALSLVNRKAVDNIAAGSKIGLEALQEFVNEVINVYAKEKNDDRDLALGEAEGGSMAGIDLTQKVSGRDVLDGKVKQRVLHRLKLASRR